MGELLRDARLKRGLSQLVVARKSQITTRAMQYWESNRQLPRDVELQSFLSAIGATPQERSSIYSCLPEPRIVRLPLEKDAANNSGRAEIGEMPGLGDLIRAMRLRARWTQDQLADAIKVTRGTISRWESTKTVPSDEDLARLASALDASGGEAQALQSCRLRPSDWPRQLTLDQCIERRLELAAIYKGDPSRMPVMDLQLLALKRHVLFLLNQEPHALKLLAELETQCAWWLYVNERDSESVAACNRALAIVRRRYAPEQMWIDTLNLANSVDNDTPSACEHKVRTLEAWLPLLPDTLQFYLLCDSALFAASARHDDSWSRYLAAALKAMQNRPDENGDAQNYYRTTEAKILVLLNKPVEALNVLPALGGVGPSRISSYLNWAAAYIKAGEKYQASRQLSEAQTLVNALPLPRYQRRIDHLVAQL